MMQEQPKDQGQRVALDDFQSLRANLNDAALEKEARLETGSPAATQPWLVLAMLLVGVVLAALDLTVVVSILTTIMNDLGIAINDLSTGAWIVSAYLLAYTVTMPFLGRVSDVYGRRMVFLGSLLVFVVGSVIVGLSTKELGLGWIIGGRVIQAIGGGAMVPVSMAVVGDIFPARRRGLALGLIGAADTAGWVIGPLYGSVMLKFLGWHSIFWINVPLGLVSAVLIFFALRASEKAKPARLAVEINAEKGKLGKIDKKPLSKFAQLDLLGFIFLGLALTGINLAFGGGKEATALAGSAFEDVTKNPLQEYQQLILIGSLVALLVFVVVELFVAKRPLLNLRTFRRLPFAAANLANFLIGGALLVGLVGVALFVNDTDKSSNQVEIAFDAALALAPLTFGMAIGAIFGGWLSDRAGYRLTTALGLVYIVFGFILMAHWQISWVMPDDLLRLFPGAGLTGLGFGTVIAPVGTAVIDWADREDIGVSAALVLILRLVGMTIGLALLLDWGLGRFRDLTSSVSIQDYTRKLITSSLAQVITEMFMAAALIAAVAMVPVLVLRRRADQSMSEEERQRRRELGRLL